MTDRRILVVEDRHDWQAILARTLRQMDFHVDIASNYEQALSLLGAGEYHMAVIDPVLDSTNKYNRDGLRVLAEIYQRHPEMHLIVVSGSVDNSTLRKYDDRLPSRLPLVEKHNWDKEAFRRLVQGMFEMDEVDFPPLRPIAYPKRTSQEMPAIPLEAERSGVPRVLVVEDRPDWQIILSRAIEEEGWFWRVVGNGDEALKMLRHRSLKFNIVLLDLRLGDAEMPIREGQGWSLLDYLSRFEPRTKVIIVSGEASRGDVAALFMKYPIAGFLDKDTFKKSDLLDLMRKLASGPRLQIQTLGGFRVTRNNLMIDDFGHMLAETFLKYLLTRRQTVVFEELAEMLCPGMDRREARNTINMVANATRMALEPGLVHPGDSSFIFKDDGSYQFNFTKNMSADFDRLETVLQEGNAHEQEGASARAIKIYEQALDLYQGEYLPEDRHLHWTVGMRTHLQTQYVKILNRLADLYARDRRFEDAITTAHLCMEQDAYHESTYRRLMRYYACFGRREEALKVYHTLEKMKREFFEEDPNDPTRRLRDAIEAGDHISCMERPVPGQPQTLEDTGSFS